MNKDENDDLVVWYWAFQNRCMDYVINCINKVLFSILYCSKFHIHYSSTVCGYIFLSGNLFSLFLCIVSKDGDEEESGKMASGRLSLKAFNIHHVLQKGSYLMAADEKFFEAEDENMRKFCTDYEYRRCW